MSGVVIRFLGSGDAFGSGGRFQTCIHVDAASDSFLIDCGASSLVAMKRSGVDPAGIATVLLTHLHGDHFGGLPFLVLDGQFSKRTTPLTVAGPPGMRERVTAAMEVLFPGSSTVERRFSAEFLELQAGYGSTIGTVDVTPFEVPHRSGAPAYAYRIGCEGKVIAYSGDCEWNEALVKASRDADLFVCEALFFDKQVPWHLDYATLRSHLGELTCKRIVLTHMDSDMLARLAEIEVEAAADGLEIRL
jgi:ribonuclease BN (tRNA processing enzyme)